MMMAESISACACLALIIVTISFLPHIGSAGSGASQVRYGSLILRTACMGYVMVGVLAFTLGITVALLSIHWKKMKQKERDRK